MSGSVPSSTEPSHCLGLPFLCQQVLTEKRGRVCVQCGSCVSRGWRDDSVLQSWLLFWRTEVQSPAPTGLSALSVTPVPGALVPASGCCRLLTTSDAQAYTQAHTHTKFKNLINTIEKENATKYYHLFLLSLFCRAHITFNHLPKMQENSNADAVRTSGPQSCLRLRIKAERAL